jgi:hypothetical protein
MTAAIEDRLGQVDAVHGRVENQHAVPVAASTTIFAHTLVSTNAAGFLIPAADDAGQAGKAVFFALAGADNSGGADGALDVMCMIRGVARMEKGALTQAAVGQVGHVLDDQTLALSSTNSREIGVIVAFTATRAEVQIG